MKITRFATVKKVRAHVNPAVKTHSYTLLVDIYTQIVFDKKKVYAKGVIYRRNHVDIEVKANKEVILSAGVFNTPKILMQSGLGPSKHLKDMGVRLLTSEGHLTLTLTFNPRPFFQIKVKQSLEHIGEHLTDQPTTFYGPVTVVHDKTFLPRRNLTYSSVLQYYVNQSGLLGWNMMSGIGYYSTPSSPDPDHPNIQFSLVPLGIDPDTHKVLNTALTLKHGYLEKFLRDHKDNDAVWVAVTLARPGSRGTLRLKRKDPTTHPVIDPNYFGDKQDLINIGEGSASVFRRIRPLSQYLPQFQGCNS